MLIRLIGHFKNNPRSIDKMIAIKGLPEDWFFTEGPEGKELKKPWVPDVEKNIPHDIRSLCEPVYLTFRYPPIEKGQGWVTERKQVLGVQLDFMTQPGRELWEKIERYIEKTIPRDQRVPKPVLLAKDPHSPFETYEAKRDESNHLYLEPSEIPELDMRPFVKKAEPDTARIQEEEKRPEIEKVNVANFKCDRCDYSHHSKQGIRMHTMKKHPEPVGA